MTARFEALVVAVEKTTRLGVCRLEVPGVRAE